ncbi:MAG: SRPBCC domain-containing protein [Paracoccaceae bacterium]|nr:SRPBCC domain-containing protein [Paracoccaceae bacterium]
MTDTRIEKAIFLATTPETVWAFLTEADKLGTWFHPAENDLVAGAPYALLGDDGSTVCWGQVLEMDKPRRMIWSFTIKPLGGVMTTVEWGIEAVPGGTRLTLTHAGFEGSEAGFGLLAALDNGWDEHFAKLRKAK